MFKAELMLVKSEVALMRERVENNEKRIRTGEENLNLHLKEIWTNLRDGQDQLKDLVRKATKENNDLMTLQVKSQHTEMEKIREQLLARVPAWALALITAGGTVIGAMLSYILNHLK